MTEQPQIKKVAVLTSGGDAPGMNAAVRAVVSVAGARDIEVLGVQRGYRGLVAGDWAPLGRSDVDGWVRYGGSALGTARLPEFAQVEVRQTALERMAADGIDALICIGGNGTLTGALALATDGPGVLGDKAPKIVGIPASIDNDIACTSLSIGVDTALNTITAACDRILDTASAHDRTFIVEVMGRDCGYLAMTGAVAAGADGVLFPEAALDEAALVDRVTGVVKRAYDPQVARNRVLIVVSEGVKLPIANLKERVDKELVAAGLPVETRVTVLGHVVRGGSPTSLDRLIAARLAHAAVNALLLGYDGVMCGWHVLQWPGRQPAGVFEIDPYVTFWPLGQVIAASTALTDGSSAISQWRVRLLKEASPAMQF